MDGTNHRNLGILLRLPRRAALLQDPSSCGESHAGCQDLAVTQAVTRLS